MIMKNINHFSVKMMRRLMSVSTSGYYDWYDRPPSIRAQENADLAPKIKGIFDEEHSRAGAKRIAKRLKVEGIDVGRHRVAKIMRLHGWREKLQENIKPPQTAITTYQWRQTCYNKISQQVDQTKIT